MLFPFPEPEVAMTAAPRRVLGPAAQLPGRAALLLVLALAACSSPGGAASNGAAAPSTAASSASAPALRVTSTLDGPTSLPVRIHWQAFPSAPDADLSEVDFLIDGRLGWVEHNTPYFYGDDGNWLVTSFLTPGEHAFTVRVIAKDGHTPTDTVRASVTTPPALAGVTWAHQVTAADVGKSTSGQPPPPGSWRLRIGPMGWQLRDPTPTGTWGLLDVGYGPGGTCISGSPSSTRPTRTATTAASARTQIRCGAGCTRSGTAARRLPSARLATTPAVTGSRFSPARGREWANDQGRSPAGFAAGSDPCSAPGPVARKARRRTDDQ